MDFGVGLAARHRQAMMTGLPSIFPKARSLVEATGDDSRQQTGRCWVGVAAVADELRLLQVRQGSEHGPAGL